MRELSPIFYILCNCCALVLQEEVASAAMSALPSSAGGGGTQASATQRGCVIHETVLSERRTCDGVYGQWNPYYSMYYLFHKRYSSCIFSYLIHLIS